MRALRCCRGDGGHAVAAVSGQDTLFYSSRGLPSTLLAGSNTTPLLISEELEN
jgi:hypothetical protein